MSALVLDEVVEAAVNAARLALYAIPGSHYTFPNSAARTIATAALAAAVPLLREQIAREIDAECADDDEWEYAMGLLKARSIVLAGAEPDLDGDGS